MKKPTITNQIVQTKNIECDPDYGGLRIVRCESDPDAVLLLERGGYEFQNDPQLSDR